MGTDTATNQEEEQITTNISTSFEHDRVISMLHKSGCLDSHFKAKLYIPSTINIWKKVLTKVIWADKKWAGFWQISLYVK